MRRAINFKRNDVYINTKIIISILPDFDNELAAGDGIMDSEMFCPMSPKTV